MQQSKKILILVDNDYRSITFEAPLKLAGYKVFCRRSIEDAIDFCVLGDEREQEIDLLIVEAGIGSRSLLEEFRKMLGVKHLMLVSEVPSCEEMYCIKGKFICLCNPSALLAAVKDLFSPSPQMKKSAKPHCAVEPEKMMSAGPCGGTELNNTL